MSATNDRKPPRPVKPHTPGWHGAARSLDALEAAPVVDLRPQITYEVALKGASRIQQQGGDVAGPLQPDTPGERLEVERDQLTAVFDLVLYAGCERSATRRQRAKALTDAYVLLRGMLGRPNPMEEGLALLARQDGERN